MEVTAAETPLKTALDQYYSWLTNLMGPKGNDRIALLSTIVTHDIMKEAPLYTNQTFRGFADRTLTISPEDFGPGNITDQYSRRYADLIAAAAYPLYAGATYTAQQRQDLQDSEGSITEAIGEINTIRSDANRQWAAFATQLNLKPGTPEYDLERANFYSPYLTLIRNQREKITKAQTRRLSIMLNIFGSDREAAQLCRIFERCQAEENHQYLPTTPDVEVTYHLDPIKIGEAAQMGLYPFARELGIDPSASLTNILNQKGSRNVSITISSQATNNHDREWHAQASGGWGFWRASVSASSESHFRQSLSNLESIKIECEYMGDFWVKRREWFDSTIFANSYVREALKLRPDLARLLALCTASAVIVRGLQVTYQFNSSNDTAVWSSWSAGGGGGFSVFGIGFGGIGGGGSGSDYSHRVDTVNKTVTFSDGEQVCRLLALRASTVIPGVSLEEIGLNGSLLEETPAGSALVASWKDASVPYGVIEIALPTRQKDMVSEKELGEVEEELA